MILTMTQVPVDRVRMQRTSLILGTLLSSCTLVVGLLAIVTARRIGKKFRMIFFIHCRRCGHSNQPDATTCAVCHRPLVIGIQNGMHCPVCGALSSAGTDVCARCHSNLVEVE